MASELQNLLYPTPPPSVSVDSLEGANFAVENIGKHLKAVAIYNDEQIRQLKSNFVVKGSQVESLSVDLLTAGTLGVDAVFVGTGIELAGLSNKIKVGANDNIIIDGVANNIQLYDDQTPQQLRGIWGSMGATGNALYFNGTSTDVNLGNPSALTEDIYALDIQFKLQTLPSAEAHDYRIWYKLGKLEAYIDDADNILKLWDHSASVARSTGQVMVVDKWYHMLIFFNNATTNGEVWLDGELVLENFSYNDTTDANTLYIGSNGSDKFFKGWIREARYWGCDTNPTAMVASEVKALDVQTLPSTVRPTNLTILRHEWQLDEGTGTSAGDTGDTGGQTGTITGGAWQTIDDNWGLRMMDKDGEVFFHVSDKVYINGVAMINKSIDGSQKILDASILDAQIANVEFAKIDNVVITNSLLATGISASKITTGTLDAGVVTVSNLNASNINTGTLTVDGTPAILITGSGNFVSQSGGDIILKSTASDAGQVILQNSSGTLRGDLAYLPAGGATRLRSSSAGKLIISAQGTGEDLQLDSQGWIWFKPTGDSVYCNSDVVPASGTTSPALSDNTLDLGVITTGRWAVVYRVSESASDTLYSNNVILTEFDMIFPEVTDCDEMVWLNPDGEINMIHGEDGYLYCKGIKPLEDHKYYNKTESRWIPARMLAPMEKNRLKDEGKHYVREGKRWKHIEPNVNQKELANN